MNITKVNDEIPKYRRQKKHAALRTYTIECCYPDCVWADWSKWRVWKRYSSVKRRDMALKALTKNHASYTKFRAGK